MTRKKFLALLLALVMMMSAIPFALAADTINEEEEPAKCGALITTRRTGGEDIKVYCERTRCLVHCPTCKLIARLCECPCDPAVHAPDAPCVPGTCFGVKITAVTWTDLFRPETSIETEHAIIRWQNTGTWQEFGRPDHPGVPVSHRIWLEELIVEIDRIFEFLRDDMGYGSPFDPVGGAHASGTGWNIANGVINGNMIYDTYRIIVNLSYNAGWSASGGYTSGNSRVTCPVTGELREVGNMSQSSGASRPYFNPITGAAEFPTFAHEIGHIFQYTTAGVQQYYNETMSQHTLLGLYPHWFLYEPHSLGHVSFSNRGFGSMNMSSPFLYEYWADLHGRCILQRVGYNSIRQSGGVAANRFSTVMAAYKGYMNYDQAAFNNDIFNASRRFVTWDLDTLRDAMAPVANIHRSAFTNDGSEWYRIAHGYAPNSYGYNAIRLEVPAGNVATVDFKGLEHSTEFPITATHRDKAGWRYGFLAMTADGTRVYGDIHAVNGANATGFASFTVPADTEYLWLVVVGAPSEDYSGSIGSRNENWAYEIKLNTAFHMDNVDVNYAVKAVDYTVLNNAIATAQAREITGVELDAALAAASSVIQAEVDTAASNLIKAIFALTDSGSDYGKLLLAGVVDAEGGNIARAAFGGDLKVSHIRHLFNNSAGHALMTDRLRDGIISPINNTTTWNTENGIVDKFTVPAIIRFPANAPPTIPAHVWDNTVEWINSDVLDRKYITMEWPQLMEVTGTRILWFINETINSNIRVDTLGNQAPANDTFVEYWNGEEWVRINQMVNDLGLGVGTLGAISSVANPTPGAPNTRWNGVVFEPILTTALRINTAKAPMTRLSAGIGAAQWEIFGEEHVCTEGSRVANYRKGVWELFCAACGEHYADEAMPRRVNFNGTSPTQLNAALAQSDVVLTTSGSGGYGIASGVTLVVPEGRTLYIDTILNVRRLATLSIEGKVVVLDSGRLNSDGHASAGFGTIIIGEDGVLVNEGYVEIVSKSVLTNNGLITNNGTTGNFGRFEVRADVEFTRGVVDGTRALTLHRNVILK